MKEIKFRFFYKNKRIEDALSLKEIGDRSSFHWADDVIIVQYTGLKDKKGIEIYEGDIVGFGLGNKGKIEHNDVNCWHIAYNLRDNPNINRKYQWDDSNKVAQLWKPCQENRVEVFGTIYENPELLI